MGADLTLVCFMEQDGGTLHTFLYLSTEASGNSCRDPEKLMQRMFPVHLTKGSSCAVCWGCWDMGSSWLQGGLFWAGPHPPSVCFPCVLHTAATRGSRPMFVSPSLFLTSSPMSRKYWGTIGDGALTWVYS